MRPDDQSRSGSSKKGTPPARAPAGPARRAGPLAPGPTRPCTTPRPGSARSNTGSSDRGSRSPTRVACRGPGGRSRLPGPGTYGVRRPARRARPPALRTSASAASPASWSGAPASATATTDAPCASRCRRTSAATTPAPEPGGPTTTTAGLPAQARVVPLATVVLEADQEFLGGGTAVGAVDGRPDQDGVRSLDLAGAATQAVFGRAGAGDVTKSVTAAAAHVAAGALHPLDAHELGLDPRRLEPLHHERDAPADRAPRLLAPVERHDPHARLL